MQKLIEFYLTSNNTMIITWLVMLTGLFLMIMTIKCKRDKLLWTLVGLNATFMLVVALATTSIHYEPSSSLKWTQIYPTKGEYSTVFLKFNNLDTISDTSSSSKTLEKLEDYTRQRALYDLYSGSIIITKKDNKEEHKVLLSRDNVIPKDLTGNNAVIDKIEYRKIDGVKKHLGKYTGQLEKRDVDGEIRITYKNGGSKASVTKD